MLSPQGLRSSAPIVWRWLAHVARSSRVRAALTALVFALSSLAGMVHESKTRHVRCSEHGELVDAGSPAVAPLDQAGDHAGVHDDAAPAAMHGHDHCLLASTTRASRVEVGAPQVAPVGLAIAELPDAPRARPSHAADALLLAAPKTSPPAARA